MKADVLSIDAGSPRDDAARPSGWRLFVGPRRFPSREDEIARAIFGSARGKRMGGLAGVVAAVIGILESGLWTSSLDLTLFVLLAWAWIALGARLGSRLELGWRGALLFTAISLGQLLLAWWTSFLVQPIQSPLITWLITATTPLLSLSASLIGYGALAGLALAGDLANSPTRCAVRGALTGLLVWRRLIR